MLIFCFVYFIILLVGVCYELLVNVVVDLEDVFGCYVGFFWKVCVVNMDYKFLVFNMII